MIYGVLVFLTFFALWLQFPGYIGQLGFWGLFPPLKIRYFVLWFVVHGVVLHSIQNHLKWLFSDILKIFYN